MSRSVFAILLAFLLYLTSSAAGQGISLADDYKKNSGLQWELALESLKNFAFSPNDKVLDVGSGDGKITAFIATRVPEGVAIGLDMSDKMVLQGSSSHQQTNLLFLQGNASSIPFQRQFDKLVSFSTLHWVLNQKQALQSMKESLKPGGLMLLVTYGKAPNNLATVAEKVASSQKWAAHFSVFKRERVYYSLEEYAKLLKESDLEILSIKESQSAASYKDRAALIAFIKPLVNFIDHLSPKHQEMFIADIADQMLQNEPPLADGSIAIHHVKIEAVAKKP